MLDEVKKFLICSALSLVMDPVYPWQINIHPLGPYSVQSVGAALAVSLAIGHNPGRVPPPTQDTSKLALILPTSEG